MAAPTPGGIGARLREARERRGLTLRQIANTTRISVTVLEALERNDISRLPGGIFSRAFVRSYAVEVGLDPEEIIKAFIAQFPDESVTAGHPTSYNSEEGIVVVSQQRTAYAFSKLIAASLPIIAIVLYFSTRGTVPNEGAGGANAIDPPVQVTERSAPPPAPVGGAHVEPASVDRPASTPDRLLIEIIATGRCWVSVSVDGRPMVSRELQAGERELFDARRDVVLTAGDASALRLTVNGQDALPLGKPGEVTTITMDLSNFREFLGTP